MIRKGTLQDIDQVEDSYTELLLHEQKYGAYTIWKLGVYPTRATVEKALAKDALYVLEQDGEICANIVANQVQPEEYGKIQWKYQALPEEVFVVHVLCVRPSKTRCGFGKDIMQFAIEEAKSRNCKAVRLDTGSQNKPAIALYTKLGFELAGAAAMDVGGLITHNDHLFYELRL